MKICLIQPRYKDMGLSPSPPLGLCHLASILEKNGYRVSIFDMNIDGKNIETLLRELKDKKPEIVGISCTTCLFERTVEIGKVVKKCFPDILLVVGGTHPSAIGEKMLKLCPFFDVLVYGEGEYTMLEIAKRYESKRGFDGVKGSMYRKGDKIISNKPRQLIENLDTLPLPAWHLVEMKKYDRFHIVTSRGCPHNCFFCYKATFERKWRTHSIEKILEMITGLVERYKVRRIWLADDDFAVDKRRVERIMDNIIKGNVDVEFDYVPMRADNVINLGLPLLKKMKKAGVKHIYVGVESVDPKILKFVRKDITIPQVEKAIKLIKASGIELTLSFMIGLPGDTYEKFKRNMQFVKKYKIKLSWHIARPDPDSEFWEWVKKNGRFLIAEDSYPANAFSGEGVKSLSLVFDTEDFTAKERIRAFNEATKLTLRRNIYFAIHHPINTVRYLTTYDGKEALRKFVLYNFGLKKAFIS